MGQTPCPCCGQQAGRVLSKRDGKTGKPLLTLACISCGLGRIDPLPTEKELSDWYTSKYRQLYKGAEKPVLRHVLRAGRNALERWQWVCANSDVLAWIAGGRSRQSLDIGASSGEFVALMRHVGLVASGIEPHQGYAAYAREVMQLNIYAGTLLEELQKIDNSSQDLITMFHVLEHLGDPVKALRHIGEKLTPEGVLYIEVPNGTRPGSPHYLFFRAHTLYFTGPTLRRMIHTAGLNVVSHSLDDANNLSIVASKGISRRAAANCVCAVADVHGLLEAQNKRRWLPYLLQQLQEGQPARKWKKRKEEKVTSAQYESGSLLLSAIYRESKPLIGTPGARFCTTP